jgi:FkbM family methyltransferase
MVSLKNIITFLVYLNKKIFNSLFYKYIYYYDRIAAKSSKKGLIEFLNKYYPNLSITLYDLGAAGGIDQTYNAVENFHSFRAIGFDPDKEDISSLNSNSKIQFFPYAIAGKNGKRKLYLTKSPGSSSLFPPNTNNLSEFPIADFFEVKKVIDINVITLSDFIKQNHAPLPDYLKADVQGAEYEVFQAGDDWLPNLIGVSFETRLRQLYIGEGLFSETHNLLSSKGFRLISRAGRSPHFSGETLEMDVAYVQGINQLDTEEKLVKAIVFCVCHENPTYAAHLIRCSFLDSSKKTLFLKYLKKNYGFPQEPQTFMMKLSLMK